MAQFFAYGATSADVSVEMQDLNAVDAFEVVESMSRNQVIVVMAPPMGEATDNARAVAAGTKTLHSGAVCGARPLMT